MPDGAPAGVAGLHASAVELAGALDDLARTVRAVPSFGELWAAEPSVAGRLLRTQAGLFGASRVAQQHLEGAGGSLSGGVWQVPGSSPPLTALAAAWESIIPHQFEVLGPLLRSRDAGDANATVGSSAWCAPAASLAVAVDLLSGGGG